MKVWIYTHDPMMTLCYLPVEAKELFGYDCFDDFCVEVPDALANEINATYKKLCQLSNQLKEINESLQDHA